MINKEKYGLIVKLLKESRTNREICKIARCSPNDITPIRKSIYGENTVTGIDMKGKSLCAQVFDLLEKKVPLSQIVIKVDIDPDKAIEIEDKYLHVSKRDRIIYLFEDQEKMALTIEILEFLKANPHLLKKIKETKDLQIIIWNLMIDRKDIQDEIDDDKTLIQYYDEQIEKKQKQLEFSRNQ